eukprot:PLAT376.1.p1 GENE.PLAT376.1~~PLAT376.1.p1  ORF type:complete len:382 (-),score=135.56 PLAT376.1:58-1203(-)
MWEEAVVAPADDGDDLSLPPLKRRGRRPSSREMLMSPVRVSRAARAPASAVASSAGSARAVARPSPRWDSRPKQHPLYKTSSATSYGLRPQKRAERHVLVKRQARTTLFSGAFTSKFKDTSLGSLRRREERKKRSAELQRKKREEMEERLRLMQEAEEAKIRIRRERRDARRKAMRRRNAAALLIQRRWRNYWAKETVARAEIAERTTAATLLQRRYRHHLAVRDAIALRHELKRKRELHDGAALIQQHFKLYKLRREAKEEAVRLRTVRKARREAFLNALHADMATRLQSAWRGLRDRKRFRTLQAEKTRQLMLIEQQTRLKRKVEEELRRKEEEWLRREEEKLRRRRKAREREAADASRSKGSPRSPRGVASRSRAALA